MQKFVVVMYYDSDVVSNLEGILFEYPYGPKFIKISEEMSLVVLRKAIMNASKVEKTYLRFFL